MENRGVVTVRESLGRLASEGFAAVPASNLGGLAAACDDECEQTGEGCFAILALTFRELSHWWLENDEAGGIPAALVLDLEALLTQGLQATIAASEPASAASRAGRLRRNIRRILLDSGRW